MGYPIFVYIYVSKIANHALLIIRGTVIATKGIEDTSSSDKTFGKITENVNVKTVLAGKQAFDCTIDRGRSLFLGLR